jgi:hypothetical protein
MMNVMVSGLLCAQRLDDSNPALPFSSLQPLAATSVEQGVTPGDARLFLFARNLLYLLVFVTSALWPAGGSVPARNTVSLKKRESLDTGQARVSHKEECDGTHANRPETGVF